MSDWISRELRILTWNTDGRIGDLESAISWMEEQNHFISPTIVLLQEVKAPFDAGTFVEKEASFFRSKQAVGTLLYGYAKKEPNNPKSVMVPNYAHPTRPAEPKQVVTLFSHHFQIEEVRMASTAAYAGTKGVRNSPWVLASVKGCSAKVAVCNVHFQVPSKTSPGMHANARLFLDALIKDRDKLDWDGYHTVLGGDFNTLPDDLNKVIPLPDYVRKNRPTNVDRKDPANPRYLRLDYLFWNGDAQAHPECEVVQELEKDADHKAVSISVMLR